MRNEEEKYDGLTLTKKDALAISEIVNVRVRELFTKIIEEKISEEMSTMYQILNEFIVAIEEGNKNVIEEVKKHSMNSNHMSRPKRMIENDESEDCKPTNKHKIRKKSKRADFQRHMNMPESDDPYDPVADILQEADRIKEGKPSRTIDDEDSMSDVDYMLSINDKLNERDSEAIEERNARIRAEERYRILKEMSAEQGIDMESFEERSIEKEQKQFVNSFVEELTGGKKPVHPKNKSQLNMFGEDTNNIDPEERQKMEEMFDDDMIMEAMGSGDNGSYSYNEPTENEPTEFDDAYSAYSQHANRQMSNDPSDEKLNQLDQVAKEIGFRE